MDNEPSEKSLGEIWELLHEINLKLENHIVEEDMIKPQLLSLLKILEQSKGVVNFLRICIYVGAAVGAAVVWIQSNINVAWRH